MVERGERNVTLATVEKIANALDLPMAELMPDYDEDDPDPTRAGRSGR